jgi:hypothetical protein
MKKQISNYPNYFIYSNGRITSTLYRAKKNDRGVRWQNDGVERELKPDVGVSGHLRVRLFGKNNIKRFSVHRLVAQAFIENPLSLPQVNHKNGKACDNRIENLYWGTQLDNMRDRYKHGTANFWESHRGEKQWSAKLNYRKAELARLLKEFFGWESNKIAKLFGVDASTMCSLLKRKTWKRP